MIEEKLLTPRNSLVIETTITTEKQEPLHDLDNETIVINNNNNNNNNNNKNNNHTKWLQLFPFFITYLQQLFILKRKKKIICYIYYILTLIILISAAIVPLFNKKTTKFTSQSHNNNETSLSFDIYFTFQYVLYLSLPYYFYSFIIIIFQTNYMLTLVNMIYNIIVINEPNDIKYMKKKYHFIFYLNCFLTILAMIMYVSYSNPPWPEKVFAIVWCSFYILPLSMIFALMLCILDIHTELSRKFTLSIVSLRKQLNILKKESICDLFLSDQYKVKLEQDRRSDIVTIDSNCQQQQQQQDQDHNEKVWLLVEEKIFQYCQLHDSCRMTSDIGGRVLLVLFLMPLALLIGTIWSIYEEYFSLDATIAFAFLTTFFLMEIGFAVAVMNETGLLVCRDMTSFLMRILLMNSCCDSTIVHDEKERLTLSQNSINKINGFLECLHFIKIEIPFFGNFVLGSRVLLAVFGSLLGAIIPAIITSYIT